MKMLSSSHLTSMSALPAGGGPVHDQGEDHADQDPRHLVPIEERHAEQLRAGRVVDPREQDADERQEQQPVQAAPRLTLRPHLSSLLRRDSERLHARSVGGQTHVRSSTIATPVPNTTTSQRSAVALRRRATRTPPCPPARLATAMIAAAAHTTGPKSAK